MFALGHAASFLPLHANAAMLCCLLLCMPIHASSLHFNFSRFQQSDYPSFILDTNINDGALQISPDTNNAPLANTSGRVLYKSPFRLHSKRSPVLASFASAFTFKILPQTTPGGEGAAFILTNSLAVPSNSYGQWLGLVNELTDGSPSNRIVAVEFDIRKSYAGDLDDNHVGFDVNSVHSIVQVPLGDLGVDLSSGGDVIASVRYEGGARIMTVDVARADAAPPLPNRSSHAMSLQIDLSQYLLEDVYVGFSASTGNRTQLCYVKSWSFTSSGLGGRRRSVWVVLVLPVVAGALFFALMFLGYVRLRKKSLKTVIELGSVLVDSTATSHRFRLNEIKSATRNFSPGNKLGQGGFGTVYKGYLKRMQMEVAVKRVAKNSRQGIHEFVAEVTTISRLRHKNLVKLLGWCSERGELLLVYEFMPRGSLDKLIFPNGNPSSAAALCWEKRHKIICGVASALSYLHDGCEMRVLHRDVKASNVMIDSNYNARLGDFGLARTIRCGAGGGNGETLHCTTVVAGTPGYIAPECCFSGRATVESDVYGFGVFAMEVTCGRRPGSKHVDGDLKTNIVDWLWDLHGRRRLLDGVDPRLMGVFDEEQVGRVLRLGLVCCHPNPNERPTMRAALLVLNGEAAQPAPPDQKPTFMWPVMNTASEVYSFGVEEALHSDGGGYLSPCTDLSGR